MVLEFLANHGCAIVNGIIFGVLFAKIKGLEHDLDWKETKINIEVDGLKKYDIPSTKDRIYDMAHRVDMINQKLGLEIEWLKKETEDLKKKIDQ